MILLYNIKLTNQRFYNYIRAQWTPFYSRIDIFKYALASFKSLDPLISKAIFYIELDSDLNDAREGLEAYINSLFPGCLLKWSRNYNVYDWRASFASDIDPLDDDLIWLSCNDDHVFIDYDLEVVQDGLSLLKKDSDPMSVIYYSHWPEQMNLHRLWNAQLMPGLNYVRSRWTNYDSIMILKKERLRHYWFNMDIGMEPVYRTDNIHVTKIKLDSWVYAPTRELVRHYDGYSHVGNMANIAPPLTIPPGFFENSMHIRFGYPDRRSGSVNINPLNPFYYAASECGADLRCLLEDTPMFWKNHITSVDIAPGINMDFMRSARDFAFLGKTCAAMQAFEIKFDASQPETSWFINHLRYLS